MAVCVRSAGWSCDLALLRAAAGNENRPEALMAATALEDQGLWVAESDGRPVAFARTARQHDILSVRKTGNIVWGV